jgi:hypothetical protein
MHLSKRRKLVASNEKQKEICSAKLFRSFQLLALFPYSKLKNKINGSRFFGSKGCERTPSPFPLAITKLVKSKVKSQADIFFQSDVQKHEPNNVSIVPYHLNFR